MAEELQDKIFKQGGSSTTYGKIGSEGELVNISALKVCCMCGDVGFSAELFQCTKCLHRFQHRYCSNRYHYLGPSERICNWCAEADVDDERTAKDFIKGSVLKARTNENQLYGYKGSVESQKLMKVADKSEGTERFNSRPVQPRLQLKVPDDDHDAAATLMITKVMQTPGLQHTSRTNMKNKPATFVKKCKATPRSGKPPLPPTSSNRLITERRYKLLSDILC